MKTFPVENPMQTLEYMNTQLSSTGKDVVTGSFLKCFHGYVGCGTHLYAFANTLTEETFQKTLGVMETNGKESLTNARRFDPTVETIYVDVEMGHVQRTLI